MFATLTFITVRLLPEFVYKMPRLVAGLGWVMYLHGWVDLDLESSWGWWAVTLITYCPSRIAELPKFKSIQPGPRLDETPCTLRLVHETHAKPS